MDFHDSILTLGFAPELNQQLLSVGAPCLLLPSESHAGLPSFMQLYLQHQEEIRSLLGELAMRLPEYQDLQWRLDIQVNKRKQRGKQGTKGRKESEANGWRDSGVFLFCFVLLTSSSVGRCLAQVASRSLKQQVEPKLVFRLDTKGDGT
jgi:hypothetical protein